MTLALKVVAEGAPAPSDDEVDCSASTPWLVLACTCVSVCCSELGGVCALEVLGPGSPELETKASDGTALEVVCTGGGGELEVTGACSPELETEASDEILLVSACAMEPGWDEVTLFTGCSAVDEAVVCGTTWPTLD